MRARRFVIFLLGLWIGGSLFMMAVATQNFRNVDRLLAAPSDSAAGMIGALGHDSARQLLRYHSSELNRRYFVWWEATQLAIGVALLITLSRCAGKASIVSAAAMVLITAAMHWLLTPQIVMIGRAIDFLPQGLETLGRSQFWKLHGFYSALELTKMTLGFAIAGTLLLRRDEPTRVR